ncbi:MAG TPA: hypothetical protein VGI03_15625 [Verrucomicrobiae bacterium]|jgi:ABC-type transport system involved in multi-copper enzyme maturation permease subunit
MQRILAIAGLTWKAALRFKLFLVIAALLIMAVVGLPLVIKDDGTAAGFTQIILTYTLTVTACLLGFSTLWLSCGTLARDIEECQIQVVATKPIARWQIWLGKWLGIVSLNAVLLILAGACIYGLLQWRATKLPAAEQQILRKQVLVARGSARAVSDATQIRADADRIYQARLDQNPQMHSLSNAEKDLVRNEILQQVLADYQLVPPGYRREWQINLSGVQKYVRDQPLQLRIKFDTADHSPSGTFIGLWMVGDQSGTNLWESEPMSLAPETFHEFQVPANLIDKKGMLTIDFFNGNSTALLFPLDDGMEVLYPEGGFAMNFMRGLGIILCWLALLAALGLAAASFLSFPVAAFFSLAMMVLVFSSGALAETVASGSVAVGNEEKGVAGHSSADLVLIPLFKVILTVIHFTTAISPIDLLSSGRAIAWTDLGLAFTHIVVFMGGIFIVIGIVLFNRRELATAQGNQ